MIERSEGKESKKLWNLEKRKVSLLESFFAN